MHLLVNQMWVSPQSVQCLPKTICTMLTWYQAQSRCLMCPPLFFTTRCSLCLHFSMALFMKAWAIVPLLEDDFLELLNGCEGTSLDFFFRNPRLHIPWDSGISRFGVIVDQLWNMWLQVGLGALSSVWWGIVLLKYHKLQLNTLLVLESATLRMSSS